MSKSTLYKPAWKWVLANLPGEDVVKMSNRLDIQVQGFREVKMSNLKTARPKLIKQIIDHHLEKLIENLQSEESLYALDVEVQDIAEDVLLEDMQNGTRNRYAVISYLLISDNEEHQQKALSLIEQLSRPEAVESSAKPERLILEEKPRELEELEGQLAKWQNECNNLQNENIQLENRLKDAETAKRRLEEQVNALTGQVDKQATDMASLEEKNAELTEELDEKKRQLAGKQQEINFLHAKNRDLADNQKQPVASNPSEATLHATTTVSVPKIKVALVGNHHTFMDKVKHYEIIRTEDGHVDKAIAEGVFAQVEKVWMVKSDLKTKSQKKIRNHVDAPLLMEFDKFSDLKKHIETSIQTLDI